MPGDARVTRTTSISRTTPRRRASTTASRPKKRWRGSSPASAATTTSSSALQYSYSAAYNTNQGNLNGTFSFGRSNAVFNPAIPSTYPDRLTVRVGGPNIFYQKAHYVAGFAQDKWRLGNNVTLNLGVRYDLEMLPLDTPDDMFVGDDHPTRQQQHRAALRPDLRPRRHERDSRRRRPLLRQDALRSDRRPLYRHAVHELVHWSTSRLRRPTTVRAPACCRPIRSWSTGPVLNRTLLNQLYPGGQLLRNTGATWDNPDRVVPHTDEVLDRLRTAARRGGVGERGLPALARPRPVRAAQSQPAGPLESGGRDRRRWCACPARSWSPRPRSWRRSIRASRRSRPT